jgi:hypothetical protein
MADRLGETLVRGFGKGQPAARSHLPVVHPREAVGGEGTEDVSGRAKETFDLHDLLLSEDRLEPVDERKSPAPERLVDQVNLQANVVPGRGNRGRPGPRMHRTPVFRYVAGGGSSAGGAGSFGHGVPGCRTRPGVPT